MGFPFEHGLHATLMTMRLADLLDVDRETESQTYYASLLMYSGCTSDADVAGRTFAGSRTENLTPVQFGSAAEAVAGVIRALPPPGDPLHRRIYEVTRRLVPAARFRKPHFTALCEVAEMMAKRLGMPPAVHGLFAYLTERWDGKGTLKRAKGDEIPLPVRIVHVARDAAYQRVVGGDDHAVDTMRERVGHAFDPVIAGRFVEEAPEIMAAAEAPGSAWEAILAAEPRPWLSLEGEGVDRALAAMGDFSDLVSPHLSGHSAGVAKLAAAAAGVCGFNPSDVALMRRAGFVHDVGRVAIDPRTWQKPAPLTVDEVGAGAPAHLSRGACPAALPAPRLVGRGGLRAPRAARRLRVPPPGVGGLAHPGCAPPRHRRRLSRHARTAPVPPRAPTGAGGRGSRRGGARRAPGLRDGRSGHRGRRAAGPSGRAPGRADRAGG
jgi:hypothetical protein